MFIRQSSFFIYLCLTLDWSCLMLNSHNQESQVKIRLTTFMSKLLLLAAIGLYFINTNTTNAQWVLCNSGVNQNLNSLYVRAPGYVLVVSDTGIVSITTNGCSVWNNIPVLVNDKLNKIQLVNNGSTGYTGGGSSFLVTGSGGWSWTPIAIFFSEIFDFYFTSDSNGWLVGDVSNGFGYLSNIFSQTIIQIPENANKALRGIYFVSGNKGWTVGDGGLILETSDSGYTWTAQLSQVSSQLNKVVFFDLNHGISIGNDGIILRTTDGGMNWNLAASGTNEDLNGVYFADLQTVWICGNAGTMLISTDGGISWNAEISGTNEDLNAIHGRPSSGVWSCGNNGVVIYRLGSMSLTENFFIPSVKLYPNPLTDESILFFNNPNKNNFTLSLMNLEGKEILIIDNITDNSIKLGNISIESGLFFYKLTTPGNNPIFGKLVVDRKVH